MGIETQEPTPPDHGLSAEMVDIFQMGEPKTLGAIQIIIAFLTLCLSVTLLQQEIHFTADCKVLCVLFAQLVISGSAFVHSGRKPSLFWVKSTLALHLVSAAFTTAALGLLSKHLPYQQDAYHCEHCRRLENSAVLLIDGILGTLVLFLVLALLICITAMLFGLSVLAKGGFQLAVGSQTASAPRAQFREAPARSAESQSAIGSPPISSPQTPQPTQVPRLPAKPKEEPSGVETQA